MRLLLTALLVCASWSPAAANMVAQVVSSHGPAVVAPIAPGLGLAAPASGLDLGRALRVGVLGSALSAIALPSALPVPAALSAPAAPIAAAAAPTTAAAAPSALIPAAGSAPSASRLSQGVAALTQAPPGTAPGRSTLGRVREMLTSAEHGAGRGVSGTVDWAQRAQSLGSVYDGQGGARSQAAVAAGPYEPASSKALPLAKPQPEISRFQKLAKRFDFIQNPPARKALLATGIFKFGMEALNITMPLIALTYFGSAVWMATMAVTWGSAMTLSSMLSGGLIDRKPVNKVLAAAMVTQAGLVAGIIGLFMAGIASPLMVLPLYAAAGATMGIVVTARDCIPARILGRDHGLLGRFNATTHIVYEIAGTIAPLLVGLLIHQFGLTAALFIHPPAYLLAALVFGRMELGRIRSGGTGANASSDAQPAPAPAGGFKGLIKRTAGDIKAGAKFIFGSQEFRWLGFMLLGPMVVHRVVEQIVMPVFVKTVLGSAEKAAWIVSGSNFGEFLGALLLLKVMMGSQQGKRPSRFRWIPLMALGTLGTWSLISGGSLYMVIPAIFAMSLTWAANDINMTSYFQSRLPSEHAGKAIGFLMAAEFGVIMASSYLLGLMFDLFPAKWAFLAINLALTALAFMFYKGRAKLEALSPKNGSPAKSPT